YEEKNFAEVITFKLMSSHQQQKLEFIEMSVDYDLRVFKYIHPTLGTHYAARKLQLQQA
ncbi:29105_t:CDS:1, partial [Racocetra persica]